MPAATCPFCGIFCGDLVSENGRIDTRSCPKAEAGFSRPITHTGHSVGGRPVPLEEAVDAAAAILRDARQPLITGLSTDIRGLQGLIALADRSGAAYDRWQSSPQLANIAVQQRMGCMVGTLAEIANRADQILVVGRDPVPAFPRIFERVAENPTPLYRRHRPQINYIGPAALKPKVALAADIDIPADRLHEAALVLAAEAEGRKLPEAAGADLPLAALIGVTQRFRDAQYGSIWWDAAAFPATQAEMTIEALLRTVRAFNTTTRCTSLLLGGSDNAMGVVQATSWQAGWPMRIGFNEGFPRFDPYLFNAERMLAQGEADALVWVSTMTSAPPPATSIPTIALIGPDTELSAPPAVAFRVGIPGLDHAGEVARADGVIAMPLYKTRESNVPSVFSVASAIEERLAVHENQRSKP